MQITYKKVFARSKNDSHVQQLVCTCSKHFFFLNKQRKFTTVTKNSTKKLESQIYSVKENISILKNKYGLVLLEYNYLTTPKKLIEYQSKYFEKDLIPLDITKIKKIKEENNEK